MSEENILVTDISTPSNATSTAGKVLGFSAGFISIIVFLVSWIPLIGFILGCIALKRVNNLNKLLLQKKVISDDEYIVISK